MSGFENKGREAFERLDARVGLSRGADPETLCRRCGHPEEDHDGTTHAFQGLSPRGDDEELKEALDTLIVRARTDGGIDVELAPRTDAARKSIESLFGRIKEELKEALAEVNRLHALSLRLRA